jgi:DNA-directed RNA polymerase subunit M/transcription elongation factor TFIIS
MSDEEARWKPTKADNPTFVCRKCHSADVWYRSCLCRDYDDTEYHCRTCQRRWWVEGADA